MNITHYVTSFSTNLKSENSQLMKTILNKIILLGAGILLSAGITARAQVVYQNTTVDTGYSLGLPNGFEVGNEIQLSGGAADINSFSFEIYSPNTSFSGSVSMEVYLLQNNGMPFNTYPTPYGVLYDSGSFALSTPYQYMGQDVETLTFDLSASPVHVPGDCTFAAVVTGLMGADSVSFRLFNPPTVGNAYDDYWANNNGGGWKVLTTTDANGNNTIGAEFDVVPEPSTISISAVGVSMLSGLLWLRRPQSTKQI